MNKPQNKAFKNLSSFCDDDFEDPWEKSESSTPLSISSDRYTEKDLIATGGMKEIYKVFDTKLGRFIAMAQIIPNTNEEFCEIFLKEAAITASLEHPNIISVYDLGVNEKHDPFFTMELKVGDSLEEIIKNEKKKLNDLLEIFLKVCDAISYSHSQNIIHLDLKPENIQVGQHGEVQVCDWGLSKTVSDELKQNTITGTPGYMAPEQGKKGDTLDRKADIFALGALLYSILTGTRPIEGGINTVLNTTVNEKIPGPIERFPEKNIPQSLDAVVCKAMAQDKKERYKSVDDLKNEVQNFLTGRSTQAENAGFMKELQLFVNRNRQVCTVVLIAFLAIIIGTAMFFNEIQKSKKETEDALSKLSKTHSELISSKAQEKELFTQKEEALKLYIDANKEKQEMYAQLLGKELKEAYDLMIHPLFYSSPEQSIKKSIKILKSQYKLNPKSRVLRNLIFLNLFISQKFNEALKYEGTKYDELLPIAIKYKDTKRTKFGILDEKDFVRFLQNINALSNDQKELKHDTVERSICYMVSVRKPIFTSPDVVRELVKSWNPNWSTDQLIYDSKTLTLRLKGKELNKLHATAPHSSSLCFLRFLKIDMLDLRGSMVPNLSHIEGLSINRIDIRNTPVKNLHPHGSTRGIKTVYLSRGQFKGEVDNKLPRSVKLIYK